MATLDRSTVEQIVRQIVLGQNGATSSPQSPISNQQSAIPNPLPTIPNLNPHPRASAQRNEVAAEVTGLDPHAELFAKDCYPSATACRKCHKQIYEEWAISSHANAAVSPMATLAPSSLTPDRPA